MPNDWTEEELSLLSTHYPHVDNKQLERLLKRHPVKEIVRKANKMSLHKVQTKRDTVLRLASRPSGMKAIELNDGERGRRFICAMEKRGELFKVVMSFKNVIYFASKKAADEWSAATVPTVKLAHPVSRARWTKDTPPHYPPGYKFTVCPSPQLDHRTNRVWGTGGPSFIDQI